VHVTGLALNRLAPRDVDVMIDQIICDSPLPSFPEIARPIQGARALNRVMIAITISGKAYAAIAPMLPAAPAADQIAPDGEYHVWLPRNVVKHLLAPRHPGETFRDVILRRAERGSIAIILVDSHSR
jgi:hypothetical protein